MIYILSTNINDKKKIKEGLSTVYGLGKVFSMEICDELGVSDKITFRQLTYSQREMLTQLVPESYMMGAELRGWLRQNKERLKRISSYRGIRYVQGLPCRGQRSHGNAQTVRKLSSRGFTNQNKQTMGKRKQVKNTQTGKQRGQKKTGKK